MNQVFEINLSKNSLVTNEHKRKCRIINFTSEWTLDEIISEISKFKGKIYKNLFCFEIKIAEDEDIENIMDAVRKFCEKRPLVVRIPQGNKKKKIFYINAKDNEWTEVLEKEEENFEKIEDFSSFIQWYESKKFKNMNTLVTEACKILSNPDQLTLRFLATLNINFETHFHLLSHCAANYSKSQFLAALYIPFCSDERFLNEFQSRFIRKTFLVPKKSILKSAIGNKNNEVLKYLTSYCSHLIRQLAVPHQLEINTRLIEWKNLYIFCDLLEFCDFVFPVDFKPLTFSHERLQKIVEERQNLHNAIENENYDEIHKFIKGSDLKLAKNVQNKTALHTALAAKKFEMYFYLKSLGFKSDDCNALLEKIEKNDKFTKVRGDSMKKNMKVSKAGDDMAINFLTARSKIFGKHSSEEHDKIRSWLEAINRIKPGSSLLNAASKCNRLMIIFDFESDDVERVDLDSPDADGIMYSGEKLVIVAAKHSTDEQEQKIKGVLAHELCHYVMRIVFENNEHPYLNEHDERFKIYKKIVDNLEGEFLDEYKDDKCEGIVSSVFTCYNDEDEFHAELIVRPIQILARYDNDELKVEQLVRRYKPLFDFLDKHLIEPMDELDLKQRKAARKFNNSAGLTEYFVVKNFKFSESEIIENVIEKKLVIARSNVPKLMLAHFYNQLRIKSGNLVDTRNIFITDMELKISKNGLKELLEDVQGLKVFINFSKVNQEVFDDLPLFPFLNFFFITPSISQSEELLKILKEKFDGKEKIVKVEINYYWKDLMKHTQNEILKTKVNFQNNQDMTLGELLESPQDIIDAELLNVILEGSKMSINSTEEEKDHFNHIFRERQFVWKNQTISLVELLKKTENQKFVLISDLAGTGKSWAMKNISKELSRLHPAKWVTFVDLKQLIPAFKLQNQKTNFHDFIVNEILTKNSKFEVQIFKQKYKTGNALFFFDGFDEIAPKSATFVQELMKSFALNTNLGSSHNQLWISTRDFFEDDLYGELSAPFTCKLGEFTVEDGINLISIIWRLYDLRDKHTINFENDIIKSEKIEEYKKLARKLCLQMPANDGIGQPLIYKMFAEATKELETRVSNKKFSNYQLFEEFRKLSKEDWSHEKGEYRTNTCNENEINDLHFHKVHQLKAMQRLLPQMSEYCDIDPENEEWKDVDLVGCGLMTKSGENYFFIHETFSEFFVAQFIVRILAKPKVDANVFEFVKEVVMNPKHEIIRMFLNEGLAAEQKIQAKFNEKAQKVAAKAEKVEKLYEIFTNNLRNLDQLGNFWFLILKHWNYEILVEVLTENIKNLAFEHENKITENGLKIFLELFTSTVDIPTIKEVIEKISKETCLKIMQEVINFENNFGENIFFVLQKTKTINEKIFEKFVKILEDFLTEAEIAEKMMTWSKSGNSVLHSCINLKNTQNLKTFWTGFEKNLGSKKFKTLLMQTTAALGGTILHHPTKYSESIDFHEAFWSLLLKTFENRKEDLKNFVLCQNKQHDNFIYTMVHYNNFDVFNWTLNKLKSIFNEDDVREILRMKGFQNSNLLQNAAKYMKQLKTHQFLWAFLLEYYKNNILEFVMDTNAIGKNSINYMVRYSTAEIFNFYIQELEKVVTKEEIRKVLCCLGYRGQNLLQEAAIDSKSRKLHVGLWTILRKYFDSSEILKFLSLCDYYGENFLKYSSLYKTKDVVEFAQNQVIKEITENCPGDFESIEKLITAIESKRFGNSWNQEDLQVLSLNWMNQGSSSFAGTKDMEIIALNIDKKVHEDSWTFLLEKYNEEEIKKILLKEDVFGVNFVHKVLRNENLEVIQLTFENIKNVETLKEIFNSKNSNDQNLLQYSACKAVDISVYKYLWDLLRTCFNSDEIFDILEHKDKFGNNLLSHAARFSAEDVALLTWEYIEEEIKTNNQMCKVQLNRLVENVLRVCCKKENSKKLKVFWTVIEKVYNSESEFKKFVKEKSLEDQETILHQMAKYNKDLECHETLWKLLLLTFKDRNELKGFVLSQNFIGHNFLFYLIRCNTSSVIRFIFETCQKTFNQAQFDEILKSTGLDDGNLLHHALKYKKDIEIHKTLWRNFSSCGNLAIVLAMVSSDGCNILNYAAKYSTAEILDFVHEELKNLDDKEKVKQIILSGRNFLIFAAGRNANLEFHKSLWKLTCAFLDTTDILDLIHSVDADGNNLLQEAVRFNTKEVVELTWNQLKTFLNASDRENFSKRRNGEGLSLIGIATKHNQPAEVIDLVKSFMKVEVL